MSSQFAIHKVYPTQRYLKAKEALCTMRSIGRKYYERNRKDVMRKGKGESLSLLEQWMIDGKMTEEQCISSAIDMLIAGVDTVSQLRL